MAEDTSDTGTEKSFYSKEMTEKECILHLKDTILPYVEQNLTSTNTELFCMLAMLNAYVPESYLLLPECQQILGPPDPIHGGPPFEERMEPFIVFINTSNPSPGHICFIHQMFAQAAVEILCSKISRSDTAKKLMVKLCENEVEPYIIQFIKDLLTKREMGAAGKQDKFSRMIEDILDHEDFYKALTVMMTASNKFHLNPIFPQAVARLNYIARRHPDYGRAEYWANKAIKRAPGSSYMADTLGQIHKNRLMKTSEEDINIVNIADKAFRAFEDVETKAENEEGQDMVEEGIVNTSTSFNNRGCFGFIQVAKIAYEKFNAQQRRLLIRNKKEKVETMFSFFSWYLTYSKPDMERLEPPYFWKDVSRCYQLFTTEIAAESTSFSGLLDCLNHGLFTSRRRRAGFPEEKKTVSELKEIQSALKASHEENVDDIRVAERYILSNIILSNRRPNSHQLTPVRELQAIIQRFLRAELRRQSPEFYLLVLLLFWPEEQPPVVQSEDDEEVGLDTDDDSSEDSTWEDTEINEEPAANAEPEQLPPDLNLLDSNLQQYVTFLETAFERYAKYLRGRYLLPLFFLGKGTGLRKWIHKSTLDAIVEENVDAELVGAQGNIKLMKTKRINDMWIDGEVWLLPEIQNILLPIRVEPRPLSGPQLKEEPVLVCVGGQRIMAISNSVGPRASVRSFYLGFNIKGLVVFGSGALVVP